MKPGIPKGTRDFLPSEVMRRNYIFRTIEKVYQKYGYLPIETPAMERLDSLTGKYGDEGDKLLFKILNNGDYLSKADEQALSSKDSDKLIASISKRGLRYDLTVPFARYVVMHQNDLAFPFKRYQIQPVWRADRPQKGRYQEFWQCDADVVGSDSLLYEIEIIEMLHEVYEALGIKVIININNRKVLQGIAEVCGLSDNFMEMTIAIDKLDKIGAQKVLEEMGKKGIDIQDGEKALSLITTMELSSLSDSLATSEIGLKGIEEIKTITRGLEGRPSLEKVKLNFTLARGLNYYTGCIFEVTHDAGAYPELRMGSISGGGRYDDLTALFGMKGNSGVGISFGADRIYDVMEDLDLFPPSIENHTQLLITTFDAKGYEAGLKLLFLLRDAGIEVELYPEPVKMKKQMKYADDRNIPYVAIIGDRELENATVMLKELSSGAQEEQSETELLEKFS